MKTYKANIRLRFIEPLLATMTGNPQVFEDYKRELAPDEVKANEEAAVIEALSQQIEKASTVFARDDKGLFLWDYNIKGMLKENIGILCELGQAGSLTRWTYKKAVDNTVFVAPRRLYLMRNGAVLIKPDGDVQRPLRADTLQGERVALARSEMCEAGTTVSFELTIFLSENAKSKYASINEELIGAALDYGRVKGIGQWRNASWGRFEWEQIETGGTGSQLRA
jgi:hypothetical protein